MATADYPLPELSRLDERTNWLEALPVVLVLPLGRIYANYLLFSAIRRYRANARFIAKVLDETPSEKHSVKGRQKLFARCAEYSGDCQRDLAHLEASESYHKLFFAPLVWWVTKTENELSDLAETCALGADPDMEALAKELSDAL